jgi:spore maturation protein CgeB
MRFLYQLPAPGSIYAGRTIHTGFRNAFAALGHEVRLLTADDKLGACLDAFQPDVFITATHFYYQKYLDLPVLKRARDDGLVVLAWLDPWISGMRAGRINEAGSLRANQRVRELMAQDLLADAYLISIEHGDARMEGFEQETGLQYHTIPLAADDTLLFPERAERFAADVSFIGTYLPQKRDYFREYVFPLGSRCRLRLYGQDWTAWARARGWLQKVGQYFNVPGLRSLQKPSLALEDERRIYASSAVSINVHEDYQRRYGGDCNERTFKIPLAGGFEVTDDVACIRKYFAEGREIVIARDKADWFEKIDHYLHHPEERLAIIEAGRRRVLAEHTYAHRVRRIIEIVRAVRPQAAARASS